MSLYQILVPSTDADGQEIHLIYHQVWDERVREIAGGLTILHDAKGKWTSPDGKAVYENMIPVMIACSREQIEEIIDFTLVYYQQRSVFAFCMSTEVIIKHAPNKVVEMKR